MHTMYTEIDVTTYLMAPFMNEHIKPTLTQMYNPHFYKILIYLLSPEPTSTPEQGKPIALVSSFYISNCMKLPCSLECQYYKGLLNTCMNILT